MLATLAATAAAAVPAWAKTAYPGQKLSDDVNRVLRLPDVTARIEGLGLQVGGGRPDEFQKTVQREAALYAKIIREANIRLTP